MYHKFPLILLNTCSNKGTGSNIYIYIYIMSEKPVNDQSYGGVGSLRYNDTIYTSKIKFINV